MVSAQLHGAMEVDQLIEYGINSHVAVTCSHVTCNQYHTRYTFVDENVQCGRYLGSYRIRMRMTLFHPYARDNKETGGDHTHTNSEGGSMIDQ